MRNQLFVGRTRLPIRLLYQYGVYRHFSCPF